MDIYPEKQRSDKYSLNIWYTDFTLFIWSISLFLHETFDEYDEYTFDFLQWKAILDTAERLLTFDTYEELSVYMSNFSIITPWYRSIPPYNGDEMLYGSGREFWKNRNRYRIQLEDVRNWTDLVLPQGEKMVVFGF